MISGIKAYSKLKWTPQEQELLRSLKQDKNIDSWKTIANQMNKMFVEKNRSGKQCRERYMNYVRFGNEAPKSTGWTQVEDHELFLKFMKHGAKWVQIGKQMPGRSQNCLKNRFYGAMRKIIRKINKAAKQKKIKQKKPIKAELLIRILQHQALNNQTEGGKNCETLQFLQGLKKQMIKIAINTEQSSSSDDIQSLIGGIIKFCGITKTLAAKKSCQKLEIVEFNEENMESEEYNLSDSYEKGSHESSQKYAKTLVENKPGRQVEGKHKIIKNLILVSSMDLIQNSDALTKSNPLEMSSIDSVSWLRKFSND